MSDDLNRVACFEDKDAVVHDGASASLEVEFLVYDYVTYRPILATQIDFNEPARMVFVIIAHGEVKVLELPVSLASCNPSTVHPFVDDLGIDHFNGVHECKDFIPGPKAL